MLNSYRIIFTLLLIPVLTGALLRVQKSGLLAPFLLFIAVEPSVTPPVRLVSAPCHIHGFSRLPWSCWVSPCLIQQLCNSELDHVVLKSL